MSLGARREELAASGIGLAGLLAATLVALASWRGTTAAGRAEAWAERVQPVAGPSDVVVVDPGLGRGPQDLGRILFPFRPDLAVSEPRDVDLTTWPFSRAVLVGAVQPQRWGLDLEPAEASGIRTVPLGDARRLLLTWLDYGGVSVEGPEGARRCGWRHRSGGVACGREPWFFVGPAVHRISGAERLCLWAHPPPDARRLDIPVEVPPLEVRGRAAIRIELQFLDEVRQEPRRPPVALRWQGPSALAQETRCDNQGGVCSLNLTPPAGGERGVLSLWTDDNRRQLVCLLGGAAAEAPPAPEAP